MSMNLGERDTNAVDFEDKSGPERRPRGCRG